MQRSDWKPIATAPLDGSDILIYTTCHGAVEARYSPGEWHDYPEGREYDGPVWVCADDAFQIEVEEFTEVNEAIGRHHGTATHWMPLEKPNAA